MLYLSRWLVCSLGVLSLAAAATNRSGLPTAAEELGTQSWPASWITHPQAPKNEFGVWLFRKTVELAAKPERFVVHVTADARYRLFVNGKSVSFGPQRSDVWVCHYDSVDLAPWLRGGKNVIAAQVWSYGDVTPYATTGVRTGFLLQGDTTAERQVDTGAGWKVTRDDAYTPERVTLKTYIVIGPELRVNGAAHPWGWETAEFDDSRWSASREISHGMPVGWGTDMDHALCPRNIPLMEETPIRFARVARAEGVDVSSDFVLGKTALTFPAKTKATILLDQGSETNAFPQLLVSGGKGARVRLGYAEALVNAAGLKGHRDDVADKTLVGVTDEFVADGGERRNFTTLDFRTYRYVKLEVETGDEPLRVDDLHGVFTGYPFVERGSFTSSDPELARVWTVGWRTARLCAFETYMDCPYYEQLQYVGDTRIQSLISLYVTGDDRLMRNAIELYDRSRLAEGLTQSRYPSVTPQLINTFSLFWIDMVHDYWRHRTDDEFVRARLEGVEAVLGWFDRKMDARTGLLGAMQYWTFVDWTDEWSWNTALGVGGEPEGARSGGSSIVSLQLALTLTHAAELCHAFGMDERAKGYEQRAASIRAAVMKLCWDEQRKLVADSPLKHDFSQHANTMAVLSGAINGVAAKDLMQRVVGDTSLIACSTYYRFYLLRAMKTVGLGDEYLAQLGPWRTMLALGLTTFAEKADPTRSDCHAWSASPVYELLATVCGIEPASPGFATVRIEPHLGSLQHAEAKVPHPKGEIAVAYVREGSALNATISLPVGVTGQFVWKGQTTALVAGPQTLTLK